MMADFKGIGYQFEIFKCDICKKGEAKHEHRFEPGKWGMICQECFDLIKKGEKING